VPVVAFGPPGPSGEMNEGKILWFLKGKVSVDLQMAILLILTMKFQINLNKENLKTKKFILYSQAYKD
jgi:hypothetical protein